MEDLIHKNCGGKVITHFGGLGNPEEGECMKCRERIIHPGQVEEKSNKTEEQRNNEEHCPRRNN